MRPRKSKRTPFKILSSSYTWYKWTHQKLIKNREEIKRIPRLFVNVAKTISLPLEFSSIFGSGRRTRNVDRKGEEGTISFRRSLNQTKRGIRARLGAEENGGKGEGKVVVNVFRIELGSSGQVCLARGRSREIKAAELIRMPSCGNYVPPPSPPLPHPPRLTLVPLVGDIYSLDRSIGCTTWGEKFETCLVSYPSN